jgi:outer membrane protein assembly factor BamD
MKRGPVDLTHSASPLRWAVLLPMRKPVLILTMPLAALLAVPVPGRALDLPSWVPFVGKKETPASLAPTSGQESEAAADLKQAESLEASGDVKGALAIYRQIVKANTLTSSAPKAQHQIGKILEQQGDYKGAYAAYADYTAKYPRGGDFDAVIQAQFNIAKGYLDGRKKKVLGVSISPSFETAQEMFEGIVKRAPFHRLAPLAQFNVGQALEKQGKPIEAMSAYQVVLIRYSGDPVADDAQYQMGYVRYRETQEGSYDQAARLKARESFEDFVNRFPSSEKTPQAKENIKSLSGTDVKSTLGIAKYYDKTKNYRAAVVYYNEVIRVAPGTPESEQSQKRIEELKGLVGVDALRTGPERAQSGDMALARRRAQARVDVASRPDYNGPAINYPYPAIGGRPAMRTTPVGPIVEPALPTGDPLQGTPGSPGTIQPVPADPLLSPTLPPPPDAAPPKDAAKPEAGKTEGAADKPTDPKNEKIEQ